MYYTWLQSIDAIAPILFTLFIHSKESWFIHFSYSPLQPYLRLHTLPKPFDSPIDTHHPCCQVEAAQQYNRSPGGFPPLVDWAKAHVERLHSPPGGHEVLITLGGNHSSEVPSSEKSLQLCVKYI